MSIDDYFVRVLRQFPYYERCNAAGDVIPLPTEEAYFWHRMGYVSLESMTVRIGSRSIRQDVTHKHDRVHVRQETRQC
jgi:hypothetical protein